MIDSRSRMSQRGTCGLTELLSSVDEVGSQICVALVTDPKQSSYSGSDETTSQRGKNA